LAREPGDLDWIACAAESAERAARLLGATKPASGYFPVVLDPAAAVAFLGVLSSALSAESVQKGRSLFASLAGEQVGSPAVNLTDDGRLLDGPGAAPVDDEGVPTQRTPLIDRGRLGGFLHNSHTAHRGATLSTGNAGRAGFRSPPGVATTNLFLAAGIHSQHDLLRQADRGVYIQEVSGVHSGANPITGEFSVGATGLRISGGALAEPLREMTVASTLRDMLTGVVAVGSDLRFFGSTGSPTVLVGEMTIGGM
jgi:PmbA protein